LDEISLMGFIPRLGVRGAMLLARGFGWNCERAERAIVAYFRDDRPSSSVRASC
jgi:hypothetical protein